MDIEARTQIPDPRLIQISFKTSIKNDHQPSFLHILWIQVIQNIQQIKINALHFL